MSNINGYRIIGGAFGGVGFKSTPGSYLIGVLAVLRKVPTYDILHKTDFYLKYWFIWRSRRVPPPLPPLRQSGDSAVHLLDHGATCRNRTHVHGFGDRCTTIVRSWRKGRNESVSHGH